MLHPYINVFIFYISLLRTPHITCLKNSHSRYLYGEYENNRFGNDVESRLSYRAHVERSFYDSISARVYYICIKLADSFINCSSTSMISFSECFHQRKRITSTS